MFFEFLEGLLGSGNDKKPSESEIDNRSGCEMVDMQTENYNVVTLEYDMPKSPSGVYMERQH